MNEVTLTNCWTITANLSSVRLDMDHGVVMMYFCSMRTVEVLKVIAEGDGNSIPMQAKIEGLSVPSTYKSGLYDLKNVEVTSNGTIQVKATEKTTWEYIESAFPE